MNKNRKLLVDELSFTPSMKILNEDQLTAVHSATLEVLEQTGVCIKHPQALEILDGAGCKVDTDRVRIPSDLVEKAISTAPKSLTLGNRDDSRQIVVEGASTHFGAVIDCVNYLDPDTQEVSECKSEHVVSMTKLCDRLDNYDWIMTLGIARDMPENIADRCVARMALEHCSKPVIVSCNDSESLKEIYEMALLCKGGEQAFKNAPNLGTLNCTISPLTHDDHLVEKNIFAAQQGIPLAHYSGMQLGGQFPGDYGLGHCHGHCRGLKRPGAPAGNQPGQPLCDGLFYHHHGYEDHCLFIRCH